MTSNELVFYLNGTKVSYTDPDPEWTLASYLRQEGLTGTKIGCGQGGCGACTVALSSFHRSSKQIRHKAVNACLYPLAAVHGLAVTTVEGVGATSKRLHPIQERLALGHGTQCGFCSPGVVMSMFALLRNNAGEALSEQQVLEALQGNLCRCTGYRPILDAMKTFCGDAQQCCRTRNNESCCGGKKTTLLEENGRSCTQLLNCNSMTVYDPSQDPIFPPSLMTSDILDEMELLFTGPRVTWHRPVTLAQCLHLLRNNPDAKLVNGNVELGLEAAFKHRHYEHYICTSHIPEMHHIRVEEDGVSLGAAVNIAELREFVQKDLKNTKPEYQLRVFDALESCFENFGGLQVQNVASLVGNLLSGSSQSDLSSIMLAAGVQLLVRGVAEEADTVTRTINQEFFLGHRQVNLARDEFVLALKIPFTDQNEFCKFYKVEQRKTMNMCAWVRLNTVSTPTIQQLRVVFGGVADRTLMAQIVSSDEFHSRPWNEATLSAILTNLSEHDVKIPADAPGGQVQFRRCLVIAFFYRFFHQVQESLHQSDKSNAADSRADQSEEQFSSSQLFDVHELTSLGAKSPVGQPLPHNSALLHCTGEAHYVDDMPSQVVGGSGRATEFHLALVLSEHAHAKVLNVDPSEALKVPGVIACLTHKDVPRNRYGLFGVEDEVVFAKDKVTCVGQPVAAIVAAHATLAREAARLVKVSYEPLPLVLTVEDALREHQKYCPEGHQNETDDDFSSHHVRFFSKMQDGDPWEKVAALKELDGQPLLYEEGEVHIGGQEHFYMEPQACLAVPRDAGHEMTLYATTQHPALLQLTTSTILDMSAHRIAVRVKRIGGGFGGKESRIVLMSLPCALAAHRLQKPVRHVLTRQEDMMITGHRHPALFKYKVIFNDLGRLVALHVKAYFNAGNTVDISAIVAASSMVKLLNAYIVPHVVLKCFYCLTNLPSNTAFRGFGFPQSLFLIESVMSRIADRLKLAEEFIRELNLLRDGYRFPFGMVLENTTVGRCWEECRRWSGFDQLKKECQIFNETHEFHKRGVALIPIVYGISYDCKMLNQGFALVHVYGDGSVLVSHGGVEMGQGLQVKMLQVASHALGIPMNLVHTMEMSTEMTANTSSTAASFSTDLNGRAIMSACEQITERLKTYRRKNGESNDIDGKTVEVEWRDAVMQAYINGVNLSAYGHFCEPNVYFDYKQGKGNPFSYFTNAAACSLVEVDALTGEHRLLSTDIVMDVGHSINPAVDIGQIEGGFMQGYGLYTMEQPRISPSGHLLTQGPGSYKIPRVKDIPRRFRVQLLRESGNPATPHSIHSSKAIGEPPLLLGISVFIALREAVKAVRSSCGNVSGGSFQWDSPATVERIRLACGSLGLFKEEARVLEENSVDANSLWEIRP